MPNNVSIEMNDISELDFAAKKLLVDCYSAKVWAIEGEMGAGKTTLVQKVLEILGIDQREGSPTYSLVNEYLTKDGRDIYHFDLYRIENQEEALNIGLEEMIYGDGLSIIEWPEIVKDLLPKETIWIKLSTLELGKKRLISYQI